ncbi:MAG: DUF4432 family protein [Anaerolineae bacterium]
MTEEITINLEPCFFGEKEKVFLEHEGLSASLFRYESGVCGLRVKNELGYITMLPFQGQQIWWVEFEGRALTMKTMFPEPRPTQDYLSTYGGFMLHCGATAMGVPTREDTHPLHGELPNAPYQKACLKVGQDEKGPYIGLSGEYQHTVAFKCNYVAKPLVKLYAGSMLLPISIAITNLRDAEMELMYMAHVNFRPVDNGRLVYSAPCTPKSVRVRTSIPSHVRPSEKYLKFLKELQEHPERHNVLSPELEFDPEVVLYIDYKADEEGWAHSMLVHPDGYASYIRHRPKELNHGVRWICRIPNQDALGIVLPSTAEPEGYLAEKAKGNIKFIPPRGSVKFELEAGLLRPQEAKQMEEKINRILA